MHKLIIALFFVTAVAFGATKPNNGETVKKIVGLQTELQQKQKDLQIAKERSEDDPKTLLLRAEILRIKEELQREYKKLPKQLRQEAEDSERRILQVNGIPKTPQPVGATTASGVDSRDRMIQLRAREIELQEQRRVAEKAELKNATPAMRQATKEVDRWNRETEWVRAHAQVRGCRGPVIVMGNREYHQVAPDDTRVYLSTDAYEHDSYFTHVVTIATNTADVPVDISVNGKLVVENLCPGGSVTLNKRIQIGLGATPVQYTAVGRSLGRGTHVIQGPSMILPADIGNMSMVPPQTWYISF